MSTHVHSIDCYSIRMYHKVTLEAKYAGRSDLPTPARSRMYSVARWHWELWRHENTLGAVMLAVGCSDTTFFDAATDARSALSKALR